MVFTHLWQFFVGEFFHQRKRNLSLGRNSYITNPSYIPTLQILPLSVVLGPRTSDLSLLPYFLHLYNEDKDTCRCYMVSVTIH